MSEIIDLGALTKAHMDPTGSLTLRADKFSFSVLDFSYEKADPLITPRVLATSTFINDSSLPANQTFTDSKTTTNTSTWSVTKGVTLGVAAQAGVNFIFTGSVTVSTTLNLSKTEGQTQTETQTWSWNASIPIPARSRVEASIVVQEAKYSPAFKARIRYSGQAWYERILPHDSTINAWDLGLFFKQFPSERVTVVDDKTIIVDVEGVFEGVMGINYLVKATQYSLDEPKSVTQIDFHPIKLQNVGASSHNIAALLDGDTIGPADGISYEVQSVTSVVEPTVICGFNDLSIPNNGEFMVETRLYHQYSNGVLLRSWQEENKIFVACKPV